MKLISMTDFVLKQEIIVDNSGDYRIFKKAFNSCEKYAHFLKQPLELGMFVPCNEYGNVLEHPNYIKGKRTAQFYNDKMDEYKQAKERCLFEGFQFQDANEDNPMPFIYLKEDVTLYPEIWTKEDTIEDLLYYNDFIELTQTVIK